MNINKLLAMNIRKYRIEKGMTQVTLAELCNLDRTYVNAIENGKRSASIKTVALFADALGIDVYMLFKEQ